jgi:Initiator Replication protein, WH1/Initiator Rep protein, WH2
MVAVTFRTIEQKPSGDEFAKARELIEIRGTGSLSLTDRRVINVLYANAGNQLCDDVTHVIGIAELRGSHKGSERVTDSIRRLMKTLVEVPTKDRKGRPATKLVPVLSDTTISDDEDNPAGQVVYSFSPGMRDIIKDSTLWGRVRSAVVFAFTSKYALALYELITARINLRHVWREEFTVEDIRALLGVPDGKLERIPNLLQRVIQPAVLEVNGLADFGVKIEPIRKGGQMRGLVTGFRVAWWRKDVPDLQAAYSELKRVKVGRMARLRGKVETATPAVAETDSAPLPDKVKATVAAMREAGAPEADIEAFIKEQAA